MKKNTVSWNLVDKGALFQKSKSAWTTGILEKGNLAWDRSSGRVSTSSQALKSKMIQMVSEKMLLRLLSWEQGRITRQVSKSPRPQALLLASIRI
ncbi:MAG TPA: hypothetical protein V6D09_20385 [Leptolyngbyaceae cyanobacterium]